MLRIHGEGEVIAVHSVKDVKNVIENKTNLSYDIKIHTQEEIADVSDTLPKL